MYSNELHSEGVIYDDAVSPEEGLLIKEASSVIGLSASALRNIEAFFNIPVARSVAGQRVYSQKLIVLFKKIKAQTSKGLQYADIKKQMELDGVDIKDFTSSYNRKSVIVDDFRSEEAKKFDLVIKPYSDRINALENSNNALTNRIIELERDNASLAERDKLHDVLIGSKDEVIASLNARIDDKKRWWKIWS